MTVINEKCSDGTQGTDSKCVDLSFFNRKWQGMFIEQYHKSIQQEN
jgi:hypothetical protein